GGLVIATSLVAVVAAIIKGALETPTDLLLLAIFLVVVGQFGVTIQCYCARVAETIDREEERKTQGR
ncbi:MAG: hypothetical protein AAF591_23725, partial [Verrucomicrobiota bacterium]